VKFGLVIILSEGFLFLLKKAKAGKIPFFGTFTGFFLV